MATPKIARGTTGQALLSGSRQYVGAKNPSVSYYNSCSEAKPLPGTWSISFEGDINYPIASNDDEFFGTSGTNGWSFSEGIGVSVPIGVQSRVYTLIVATPDCNDYQGSYYNRIAKYYGFEVVCMTADVDFRMEAGSIGGRAILTAYVSVTGGVAPYSVAWAYPAGAVDASGNPFTANPQFVGNSGAVSVEFYHDFPDGSAIETLALGVTVTDSDSPACSKTETREASIIRAPAACPDGQHDDGTGVCVIDPTGPQPCAPGFHYDGAACVPIEPTDLDIVFVVTLSEGRACVRALIKAPDGATVAWERDGAPLPAVEEPLELGAYTWYKATATVPDGRSLSRCIGMERK